MTTQSKSLRLADKLTESPYAWPGIYPLYAVTDDGAALCHKCTKNERDSIGTTTGNDGWCIVDLDINYEDPNLYCAHCDDRIESAYSED